MNNNTFDDANDVARRAQQQNTQDPSIEHPAQNNNYYAATPADRSEPVNTTGNRDTVRFKNGLTAVFGAAQDARRANSNSRSIADYPTFMDAMRKAQARRDKKNQQQFPSIAEAVEAQRMTNPEAEARRIANMEAEAQRIANMKAANRTSDKEETPNNIINSKPTQAPDNEQEGHVYGDRMQDGTTKLYRISGGQRIPLTDEEAQRYTNKPVNQEQEGHVYGDKLSGGQTRLYRISQGQRVYLDPDEYSRYGVEFQPE